MSLSKSRRDRRWLEPEPRITVYAIEDLGLQMLARLIRDPRYIALSGRMALISWRYYQQLPETNNLLVRRAWTQSCDFFTHLLHFHGYLASWHSKLTTT